MAAHGWAAVVNLAGIPYHCIFLEDLSSTADIEQYDALILAQCGYVEDVLYNNLLSSLEEYLKQGGNIIIDGPLALNDGQAKERDHNKLDDLLNFKYNSFYGNSNFRLKVHRNRHYITQSFETGEFITQHVVNGLNITEFNDFSDTLITFTDEKKVYPFLSTRASKNNRIVLVNDFSTWSGVSSFFRNNQPQVFYANQIFNILIRTVHWTIFGNMHVPFPVPQVSNAQLTAIIRLDADASGNLDAQIKTINYLVGIAKESGVVPLYAWVSSQATKAGWQDLAPLGKMIENVGGQIGSHSRFHHINREMTEKRWKEELDDGTKEIGFNMNDYGYPIGKVEFFINPGNTIHMDDYEQIARRFTFYMTHGFEQDMPLGYGNLTWFTGPYKNLVVLEDTPSPDYQWFYDPTWSYTTAQITAYQEAIFDHMYKNIGRGIIFDQMWHDYSITNQPQYGKDRIINKNNIAMYDALKAKFTSTNIYCPDPIDLGNKIRAMAQWNYSWEAEDTRLKMTIDITDMLLNSIAEYTGSMGIKIENTNKYISHVLINGYPHLAFNANVVILPNLKKNINEIIIELSDKQCDQNRLIFISKRMPQIQNNEHDLISTVLTKSRAKFTYYIVKPSVLLNSDWYEWNRKGDNMLNGYVVSDRNIILRELQSNEFFITYTDIRFLDISESVSEILLILAGKEQGSRRICFQSINKPRQITLESQAVQFEERANQFQIKLPEYKNRAKLCIKF